MAHTGDICFVSGIYKCSIHPSHLVIIYEGGKFFACNKKDPAHPTIWMLVKKIII
ncbi:MAG: hypothetical protein ABI448_14020 [Bacteroidia bacterium]